MKVDISRNWRVKPRIVIHEHDTWEMCNHLAKIIHPMLVQLKKQKPGIPGSFFYPGYHDLNDEEQDKFEKEAKEKWNDILDKMIWSMEHIAKGNDGPPLPPCLECGNLGLSQKCKVRRQVRLTDEIGGVHLWEMRHICTYAEGAIEQWRIDYAAFENLVQEGCELFGKYFKSLWT